jgi:4'-phosphopantetheinyl transferase
MPLYKTIVIEKNIILYFWKITETTNFLIGEAQLNENSKLRVEKIKFESHKKGFLATKLLLQSIGYTDFDLFYDARGKPYLKDENHISISHSHDFSAIAISDKKIGLDIEKLKEKTLKNASRFMTTSHLEHLNDADKIKKATIIWGIKEAIFKIKNNLGISFSDAISESPFSITDKKTIAKLNFNSKTEDFKVVFDIIEDYTYVCVF